MKDVRVLLVDGDPERRREFASGLTAEGHRVNAVADGAGVHRSLAQSVPDAVLIDADALDGDLGSLVSSLKEKLEFLPVIVLTESADASTIAESMRRGAFDFLSKPVDFTRLEITLKNAVRLHRLMIKVNQLQSHYRRRSQFLGIIGASAAMQTLYSIIENVGETDVTVLITGGSGTGKELVARALHDVSPRSGGSFVAINCAAIPNDLLESELFGHERGAFTGAMARYVGCCEQADGGTLFLDEICEMDVNLQSKLLRFLQERRFHRLGSKAEVHVNVRVVAATNRDPVEEVEQARLREDLYYRLNVVPVEVPLLKNRKEDVPLLAEHFLERFSTKYAKYFYDFSPEAMGCMLSYDWPGNVRELENTIERIVVLNNDSQVSEKMLPPALRTGRPLSTGPAGAAGSSPLTQGVILPMQEVERRAIEQALSLCEGNVSQAARRLGIGQATLYRKIKKYGLAPTRA